MEKRLTIAELSDVLQISVQAGSKKVKKLGLKTTKELINNRLTTIVLLSDDQLNELILNANAKQPAKQSLNQFNQPVYREVEQPSLNQFNKPGYEEILTRVLDFTEKTQEDFKLLYKELSEKDSQVKLLEDSEKRKENDYLKQISELKSQLAKVTSDLEAEKSKKWWKLGK